MRPTRLLSTICSSLGFAAAGLAIGYATPILFAANENPATP
jgi:hypothetical protein